ncbi:MAG: metalloregulator ArsR/SmtB family transcription factor [Bacteroidota bacterium]|nr:metalloregulator ArsR/SmtB family transcription factor [Bacteroidota bacterium]
MKALSNKNRFEIFMVIYKSNKETNFEKEECFVYDIIDKLNIGAPTISHHLKELSNADLIITERRGKQIVATINKETVKGLSDILDLKD